MRLEELAVHMNIFEANRVQTQLAKLPQGALGSFSFHEATPRHIDLPAMEAHLSGWFVLNAQSFDDAWNQVQQGGYSECTINLDIGPIETPKPIESDEWLWDVANSPRLIIETVSVAFIRLALQLISLRRRSAHHSGGDDSSGVPDFR